MSAILAEVMQETCAREMHLTKRERAIGVVMGRNARESWCRVGKGERQVAVPIQTATDLKVNAVVRSLNRQRPSKMVLLQNKRAALCPRLPFLPVNLIVMMESLKLPVVMKVTKVVEDKEVAKERFLLVQSVLVDQGRALKVTHAVDRGLVLVHDLEVVQNREAFLNQSRDLLQDLDQNPLRGPNLDLPRVLGHLQGRDLNHAQNRNHDHAQYPNHDHPQNPNRGHDQSQNLSHALSQEVEAEVIRPINLVVKVALLDLPVQSKAIKNWLYFLGSDKKFSFIFFK